jgi:hypothetical protein
MLGAKAEQELRRCVMPCFSRQTLVRRKSMTLLGVLSLANTANCGQMSCALIHKIRGWPVVSQGKVAERDAEESIKNLHMPSMNSTMSFKNLIRHPASQFLRALPWHVSLLLGEAIVIACKWVLPAMCSNETFSVPVIEVAWCLSCSFWLLGAANLVARLGFTFSRKFQ